MELANQIALGISSLLFLYYGLMCLFTDAMVEEFERYGLSRFRMLTGLLEVLGALGLLVGYFLPANGLFLFSAGGLTLLMAMGLATRIRVRDTLLEMLPALVLMLVNLFLFLYAAGIIV